MFARASKCSLPQDVYKQSISCLERLQLPFLCPALYRQTPFLRTASSITYVRSRKRSDNSHTAICRHAVLDVPSQNRSLASAATVENPAQTDTYIPWEQPDPADYTYQQGFNGSSIASLPAFDPSSSPIIINDSLATHPRKFKAVKDAVSGDLNEIHQTLHACLQVGRLERAATLVRRLHDIYKSDAPGLIAAHNDYISELAHRVVQYKDEDLLSRLQRWFQVEVRDRGVKADETTYAMMVRASLQKSIKYIRDYQVRRYLDFAKEAGLEEDTQALLSSYDDVNLSNCPHLQTHNDPALANGTKTEPTMPENPHELSTEPVEEVRQMEQKGSGLATLKKSLSIFSNSHPGTASDDKNMSPVERQSLLEINTVNATLDRWREEDAHLKSIGINSSLSSSTVGAMMWRWHEKLVPLIKDDIRKSEEAEQKSQRSKSDEDFLAWGPYLQSLPPEKASAIAIVTAMKICSTETMDEKGVRIHTVVQGIGNAIQDESIAEAIRRNGRNKKSKGMVSTVNARSKFDATRRLVRGSKSREYDKMMWLASSKVKLGAVLLSHLMDVAKLQVSKKDPKTGLQAQELQPVFFHTYQYVSGKRVGVVRLNSKMTEKLSKVPIVSALAKYLPMICEPKPWVGFLEGGFLEYPVPVVRLGSPDSQSKHYAITAAENGDMTQVFAGLDVLAKTPWNINRFVFDVMLEAWNSGQAIAGIPPESPPNDLPPEPAPSDNLTERYRWMRHMREAENYRLGLRSQRCFQNFQLEVARSYLNETFYFPHNCDFRGRAYPMAPFLNHMGADNVRGLLTFAQGKELTSDGLWWLKVHLANVYGYDKASFAERLAFTDAHISEIRDSVNKPLGGEKWWLKAEDPWQCLAACKELKNALDLPDPTKYMSKLAVHQDGTCNGLQHYAALGGDVAGAQQVNLEPGPRPSDIYTGVSELVKAEIAKDAAQGSELAKALDGKVTRKVVKQTVMTNVYGVTFTGAKRQVRKQLDDLLVNFPDTYDVNVKLAAPYIAKKIFAALATMFNGAHDIQHWLVDCAGRISESLSPEQVAHVEKAANGEQPPSPFKRTPVKARTKTELTDFKTTVIWTTPLKMPVVQPYRKKSARGIETKLQKITIANRSAADPVHKSKQLQAFPPNFIHSLDATHMFLTALKCNEVGLTFAAIHDSFWTHAGDVHTMNRVIRDAFIRMHSEDIIGRLAAEFRARYKGYMQLAAVRVNSPLGQKIMAWRREKSKEVGPIGTGVKKAKNLEARKWDELVLERRRLKLLASEDPKEREKGQQMNTPGKIFSEAADEKSLAPMDAKPAMIGGLTRSSRDNILKANQQLDVGDMHNAEPVEAMTGDDSAAITDHDIEASEDGDLAAVAEEDLLEDKEDNAELSERTEDKPAARKSRPCTRKVWVWLPLNFPPVPKKGDFDVKRLKDSQYFFS